MILRSGIQALLEDARRGAGGSPGPRRRGRRHPGADRAHRAHPPAEAQRDARRTARRPRHHPRMGRGRDRETSSRHPASRNVGLGGSGGLQPPRPTSSDDLDLTRCNLRCHRKVLRRRSGVFAVSGQAFRGGRVKRNSSRVRGMSMLPQHRAVNCAPLGGNAPWITLIPRVSRNSATGTKSRSEDTSTAMS